MSLLSSAVETLRDRGPRVLAVAAAHLVRANVHRRLLRRRFIERRVFRHRMLLDLEDPGISRSLVLFGSRELEHKLMLEQVVVPGMRIFDVGANIGYYALLELGLLAGTGRVVAIEPSPSNLDLLRRNLALNDYENFVVVEGAVSNRADRRRFYLARESNLNTFHPTGSATGHMSGASIDVDTFTIADLAREHGPPDLVRMDVEGHEVEILGGMIEDVAAGRLRPTVIFETHLSRYSRDHDMEAVLRALFDHGYRVRLAGSSSTRGTALIESRGYRGNGIIRTDGVERAIFADLSPDDAVDLICRAGGVRTVVLAPDPSSEEPAR